MINRVRKHMDLPLAFGIGTGDQTASVTSIADGVIVGSALVKARAEDGLEPVRVLAGESHNPV